MHDDAAFDNMSRAMLSPTVCARMQHARNQIQQQSNLMYPIWKGLNDLSDTNTYPLIVICPIWLCATLSLMSLPALLRLAPLYVACILASIFCGRHWWRGNDYPVTKWPHLYLAMTILWLAVAIFVLGLQLDGMLQSPKTVAALFWGFVTILGIGVVVLFGPCICLGREHWCRIMSGFLAWALAVSSADLGIAALLEKAVGGTLAEIPYSIIVLLMIMCVPACSCLWTVLAFYI